MKTLHLHWASAHSNGPNPKALRGVRLGIAHCGVSVTGEALTAFRDDVTCKVCASKPDAEPWPLEDPYPQKRARRTTMPRT